MWLKNSVSVHAARLSIAVRKGDDYTGASFLQQKVATSYPVLLKIPDEQNVQRYTKLAAALR